MTSPSDLVLYDCMLYITSQEIMSSHTTLVTKYMLIFSSREINI